MSFPRERVLIDDRRRLTLPKKFIQALGITEEELKEHSSILLEAHPSLEECKFLSIKRR